jgi:hypothetical protein
MRTGHKQGEMQLTCFSEIGTAPEAEQLFLLSCLCAEKQELRFLLLQSRPSPRASANSLFATGNKRPLKEEEELFPLAFTLGFCFWLFGVGSFWRGKELV